MIGLIFLVPLVLVVLYIVSVYNFFAGSKARIKASIQEIGNQLQRQVNLIPNLENSVKGYLAHEKEIFEKIASARKMVSEAINTGEVGQISKAGNALGEALSGLRVSVESTPEIKGVEVVAKLMDELRDTADKVMYSTRLMIDLSADYNVKRVSFPSNFVANLFKFEEMKGLETPENNEALKVTEAEMKTPEVKL